MLPLARVMAHYELLERQREQERQDNGQLQKDICRALGERNDARARSSKLADDLRACLASERALADRLAETLKDIEGRCGDTTITLHPDADAKGCVDDCWEWSEQALAAWKEARRA